MSVYLMGAYDPTTEKSCTVTKVGSGFKYDVLLRLHEQSQMIKISKVFFDQRFLLRFNRPFFNLFACPTF